MVFCYSKINLLNSLTYSMDIFLFCLLFYVNTYLLKGYFSLYFVLFRFYFIHSLVNYLKCDFAYFVSHINYKTDRTFSLLSSGSGVLGALWISLKNIQDSIKIIICIRFSPNLEYILSQYFSHMYPIVAERLSLEILYHPLKFQF